MHTLLPTLTLVIALTTAIRLLALLNYLGFSDFFFLLFFFLTQQQTHCHF